jgi:hypothetical protein
VEQDHYIIERFKLLLDEDAKDNWPVLPKNLDVKTVIADYFVKMKGVCNIHIQFFFTLQSAHFITNFDTTNFLIQRIFSVGTDFNNLVIPNITN